MAERDFITLEDAIEGAGHSLEPLFKAAAAWFALREHFQWAEKHLVPVDEPMKRVKLAYEHELGAARACLVQLLADGAWAIAVRRWDRLDEEAWTQLRPDVASRLNIQGDPSAKSLTLHGPDGGRLDCRLSEPATEASAPAAAEANETKIPLKKLLEGITDELPFPAPAGRVHGWKTAWATKAANIINQRHLKEPKRVKGTTRRSVQNTMSRLKLWQE
jgi:hypothetical protein